MERIDRAIILAAGCGKRFYEKYPDTPKPLIPLNDRPMITYPIMNFINYGIKKLAIVIKESDVSIKNILAGYFAGISIEYFIQKVPEGTSRALLCAGKYIENESFFMTYCDNIGNYDLEKLNETFVRNDYMGVAVITDNPENPGTAEADIREDKINFIYEKPAENISRWKISALYAFHPEFFKYLKDQKRSLTGEYEIANAINNAISSGEDIGYIVDNSKRVNLNSPDDIPKASTLLKQKGLRG
ncbi:MAG: sugar phosphate nucleotidyltransferase [Elusimicrobiota bacterium]